MIGLIGHHPQRGVAGALPVGGIGIGAFGYGRASGGPHLRKRALKINHRRPGDFDAGVAPGRYCARRVAFPTRADAQARHITDAAIHGHHFAVIALQPAKRAADPRFVKHAQFGAGFD